MGYYFRKSGGSVEADGLACGRSEGYHQGGQDVVPIMPTNSLWLTKSQVTHTNDLASLALTNSALHRLAIPHIYGRFDIVWPDAHNTAESRTGVDALTYGLATLVMGEEIFGNPQPHMNNKGSGYCQSCMCDRCQSVKSEAATGAKPAKRYRRGNYFARFTKKFSLGNGPPDWVQEYLITKEAGKMLGTLVALSIARMPSLETFIWDMPTGILRDIWISLASLGDRGNPRLERLWIRFHDNRETFTDMGSSHPLTVPQPTQNQLGVTPTASNLQPSQELATTPVATLLGNSYRRTEHPNFSILSPLKSLSVLDVDEPAYLDEISVLIGKSIRTLRELRIGIASTASDSGWASLDSVGVSSEEPDEDNTTSTIGGVLGLMMSKIYNPYVGRPTPSFLPNLELLSPRPVVTDVEAEPESSTIAAEGLLTPTQLLLASHGLSLVSALAESEASLTNNSLTIAELDLAKASLPSSIQTSSSKAAPQCKPADEHRQSSSEQPKNRQNEHLTNQKILPFETLRPRKLQLDVLEMERIVMDVKIIQESINWSIITSLTLLQCGLHEELWRALRTKYGPRPTSISTSPKPASKAKHPQSNPRSDYRLNLKKIHTDTVSPALITFLKETLAPDSLQWMFLQDGRDYKSPVTIETIFRGPLKRHRGSLTKVMIDSAIGKPDSARNSKREKWICTRELLAFITSGKMTCLKELAMSVEYKDWVCHQPQNPQSPYSFSNLSDSIFSYRDCHRFLNFARSMCLILRIISMATT